MMKTDRKNQAMTGEFYAQLALGKAWKQGVAVRCRLDVHERLWYNTLNISPPPLAVSNVQIGGIL